MYRYFISFAWVLLLVIPYSRAASISEADRQIFYKFCDYANKHTLAKLPVNERIPLIAQYFKGRPYQNNTLNICKDELPVINLREFDCVTLVENVLALAYLDTYHPDALQDFVDNIMKVRYRNGKIEDYTSRLHYSSDWLYEMQKNHLLTDLTYFAGGVPYRPEVSFMSEHYENYPPLKQDKRLRDKIKTIETEINKRTYYYIPKTRINETCHKIKNGDIILITTHIKGLDTSHIGFAWKKDGKTYLLHASSKGKKVMISELPLQDYMEGIRNQSGIMVARVIPLPPIIE